MQTLDCSEETYLVIFTESEFYKLLDLCEWFRKKVESAQK